MDERLSRFDPRLILAEELGRVVKAAEAAEAATTREIGRLHRDLRFEQEQHEVTRYILDRERAEITRLRSVLQAIEKHPHAKAKNGYALGRIASEGLRPAHSAEPQQSVTK